MKLLYKYLFIFLLFSFGYNTGFGQSDTKSGYHIQRDVTMMAQGSKSTNTTNCFFLENGTLTGPCNISSNEGELDFIVYCSKSLAIAFYSPANATNIAKNYQCSKEAWSPEISKLKATHFRVLVPGNRKIDAIYAAHKTEDYKQLNDAFFAGISRPSSLSPKYNPDETQASSSQFNTTTANLIWVTIPQKDGSLKNALIAIKSVNIIKEEGNYGLSTITFDIISQK